MSLFVDQSEINSVLWKACDTFRGTIDASDYKNHLPVAMFVQWHILRGLTGGGVKG